MIWSVSAVELEILWIATHPKYARMGLGRKLVEFVENSAWGQRVILAKTAAPDATIRGSSFSGRVFRESHLFFTHGCGFKLGGPLRDLWGPGNHATVFVKHVADRRGPNEPC